MAHLHDNTWVQSARPVCRQWLRKDEEKKKILSMGKEHVKLGCGLALFLRL